MTGMAGSEVTLFLRGVFRWRSWHGLRLRRRVPIAVLAMTAMTAMTAVTAVTAMTAMTEQMHGDHPASEQNPDPVVEEPLHVDIPYCLHRRGGS